MGPLHTEISRSVLPINRRTDQCPRELPIFEGLFFILTPSPFDRIFLSPGALRILCAYPSQRDRLAVRVAARG
jgi:hypothetical protein